MNWICQFVYPLALQFIVGRCYSIDPWHLLFQVDAAMPMLVDRQRLEMNWNYYCVQKNLNTLPKEDVVRLSRKIIHPSNLVSARNPPRAISAPFCVFWAGQRNWRGKLNWPSLSKSRIVEIFLWKFELTFSLFGNASLHENDEIKSATIWFCKCQQIRNQKPMFLGFKASAPPITSSVSSWAFTLGITLWSPFTRHLSF